MQLITVRRVSTPHSRTRWTRCLSRNESSPTRSWTCPVWLSAATAVAACLWCGRRCDVASASPWQPGLIRRPPSARAHSLRYQIKKKKRLWLMYPIRFWVGAIWVQNAINADTCSFLIDTFSCKFGAQLFTRQSDYACIVLVQNKTVYFSDSKNPADSLLMHYLCFDRSLVNEWVHLTQRILALQSFCLFLTQMTSWRAHLQCRRHRADRGSLTVPRASARRRWTSRCWGTRTWGKRAASSARPSHLFVSGDDLSYCFSLWRCTCYWEE